MIFPLQRDGDKPPLIGVHILGGRASYFKALSNEFGPDQPVFGVSFGMLARDKHIGVEKAAAQYFDEIQKFQPEGPLHLAAVSLGAYFAWELARLLNEAGREIGHFALFDADGPDGRDSYTGLGRIRANFRTVQHRGYGAIPTAIHNRIQELRHVGIAFRMRQNAKTGKRIEIRGGADFIAANELVVAEYRPKPLAVPFTIYRSNENFFDSEECLRSGLGWESVALGGYDVVDVPGGHLTMLDPPHVEVLARHMAQAMNG